MFDKDRNGDKTDIGRRGTREKKRQASNLRKWMS